MTRPVGADGAVNRSTRAQPKNDGNPGLANATGGILDKFGYHRVDTWETSKVNNWFTKGPDDGVQGTRTNKAYQIFELPETLSPKPVIVAVIDSGVDIEHEDLRGAVKTVNGKATYPDSRIWTNEGEIPGDGIDNDGNGYIDDVHGWNFLGSYDASGKPTHVGSTTLEVTREFLRLKKKADAGELTPEERRYYEHLDDKVPNWSSSPHYDLKRDRRMEVIGDNQYDFSDRNYGNNAVEGPGAMHGTHVSGIIAAIRNNSKGIMGVAADVQIMPIRAVPDGDEYDKDVANAIRYAADNGAQVINMSFGKAYASGPGGKKAVEEAVAYAKQKGVKLFVHAAGNDGADLTTQPQFGGRYPNDRIGDNLSKEVPGWLEIGASTTSGSKASFSNYGRTWVDVFAPGHNLKSTVPNDRYQNASGTSMASPVAAGVAAVVLSVFPQLSSEQLEEVMGKSARPSSSLGGKARNEGIADLVSALEYAGKLLGTPLPRVAPKAA